MRFGGLSRACLRICARYKNAFTTATKSNSDKSMSTNLDSESVRQAVRDGYGQIAQKDSSCCSGVSCCGSNAEDSAQLAKYVGYSSEELATLPDGANMGLSCGNPNALATLQPGEVVLDLGS